MKAKGDEKEDDDDKEVTPSHGRFNHRKVWGCGFYAGVKAAGGNPDNFKLGGTMNQSKANILVSQLSVTERKVLEAVPINHWWTAKQIHTERCRLHNSTAQLKSTSHVLSNLKSSKMVREDAAGKFQRCPVSYKADPEVVKYAMKMQQPELPAPKEDSTLAKKPTPAPNQSKSNVQCITTKKEMEAPTMTLAEAIFENIRRTRELLTRIEVDVLALEEQGSKKQEDMISLTQLKKLLDGQG